jgi:hypothetical protein
MTDKEGDYILKEALEIGAIAKAGSVLAFEKTGGPEDKDGEMAAIVNLFDAIQEKAEKLCDASYGLEEEPQPAGKQN